MTITPDGAVPYESGDFALFLRDAGVRAPAVLEALTGLHKAQSKEDANRLYRLIDNEVVVQGTPTRAAPRVVSALATQLPYASVHGHRAIVDLLLQLVCGSDSLPFGQDTDTVVVDCRTRLAGTVEYFYALAVSEDSDVAEPSIEIAAYVDPDVERFRTRAAWLLENAVDSRRREHLEYWLERRAASRTPDSAR